ncbi:MAG: DUF177 domain-containing protein [Flavobacteriia bacterium]|nr:DUF177 domain-containing protein [Flavobacteriia bacterium]
MSKHEYIIPFVGLKIGFHVFEFEISDAFFDEIEYSIIHSGNVHVRLELEKKETMLVGHYQIEGLVKTGCDRCNDPIEVEIDGEYQMIYKFGGEATDDETLIVLDFEAYELDVKMNIYELISVSLPVRVVHEAGECNPEMLALLEQYVINVNDEEDDDDFDDDDEFDEDDDEEDLEDEDGDGNDNDDIDPRWSILKNLN